MTVIFAETVFTSAHHAKKKEPANVNIPEDAAAIEPVEYPNATTCTSCHGKDLDYLACALTSDPATTGQLRTGSSNSDV